MGGDWVCKPIIVLSLAQAEQKTLWTVEGLTQITNNFCRKAFSQDKEISANMSSRDIATTTKIPPSEVFRN